MALKRCSPPGCGIDFYGNICPKCGREARPEDAHIARRELWIIGAAISIFIVYGITAIFRAPAASASSAPMNQGRGWVGASGHIDIGIELYMNDNKRMVGAVKNIQSGHLFPDGTTRDGVLISFKDGGERWVPREAVKRLYVVKQ